MSEAKKKDEGNVVQLGIFPGWKASPAALGEEKPRLDAVIVIKIKDNKTGEKFTREVHQDFYDGDKVFDSIVAAVEHRLVEEEVRKFCSRRSGFPESVRIGKED